jgi:hypothetical protein
MIFTISTMIFYAMEAAPTPLMVLRNSLPSTKDLSESPSSKDLPNRTMVNNEVYSYSILFSFQLAMLEKFTDSKHVINLLGTIDGDVASKGRNKGGRTTALVFPLAHQDLFSFIVDANQRAEYATTASIYAKIMLETAGSQRDA